MQKSAGIFDVAAVRQSCWQTCDGDPGKFPMDLGQVPAYRDNATRAQFYEVATFFGCVDICEDGYEKERLLFIIPAVAAVLIIIVVFLICWFCRCCLCYKLRKQRGKQQNFAKTSPVPSVRTAPTAVAATTTVLQSTSSTLSTLMSAKSPLRTPQFSRHLSNEIAPKSKRKSSNLSSKKKKALQGLSPEDLDLNDSVRSNVSVNMWVADNDRLRRESLLKTATKLGRRLVALDKHSEEAKRRHRKERERKNSKGLSGTRTSNAGKTTKALAEGETSTTGINNPPMRF